MPRVRQCQPEDLNEGINLSVRGSSHCMYAHAHAHGSVPSKPSSANPLPYRPVFFPPFIHPSFFSMRVMYASSSCSACVRPLERGLTIVPEEEGPAAVRSASFSSAVFVGFSLCFAFRNSTFAGGAGSANDTRFFSFVCVAGSTRAFLCLGSSAGPSSACLFPLLFALALVF